MVVWDEISIPGSNINQKPNSATSVMLCTRAAFVNKSSYLVARIVSFDTVGLHLLTFCISEPFQHSLSNENKKLFVVVKFNIFELEIFLITRIFTI